MTDNEDHRNFDEASPEEQAEVKAVIREAIRAGAFSFSDEAKVQMQEKGITEDELVELLMKKVGLDS